MCVLGSAELRVSTFCFRISQLFDAFAVRNGLRLERPSIPTQVPAESIIISYSSQSILISTVLSCLSCISDPRASTNKPFISHNWQAVSFFLVGIFNLFSTIFSPLFPPTNFQTPLYLFSTIAIYLFYLFTNVTESFVTERLVTESWGLLLAPPHYFFS